jgi:hypothetical protein
MHDRDGLRELVILDEIVPAGRPWGQVVRGGEILRLIDLEGQQAVDFLCFDAADRGDRYSATNTIKMQGNIYIGADTVLCSDRGTALFTVITDTCGRHDTIYGCCSEANNFLRYGVRGTLSCYANFCEILARFGLDERSIVCNVNFFIRCRCCQTAAPVSPTGSRNPAAMSSCVPSGTSSPSYRTAHRCTIPATATTRRQSKRRSIGPWRPRGGRETGAGLVRAITGP